MKRAPRSRQRHDLYAKYHDYDSEISDLLGECGFMGFFDHDGTDSLLHAWILRPSGAEIKTFAPFAKMLILHPLAWGRNLGHKRHMIYGYARVSTDGQDVAAQAEALRAAGCETIVREVASGARERPRLKGLLNKLSDGDVLIVTRIDRLARSSLDLHLILDTVAKRGAGFRSLGDAWADTTSPHGRLLLAILAGLAEYERELIKVRTGEGRAHAKARGVRFGAPTKLTPYQQQEALERLDRGEAPSVVALSYGVSRWTIQRLRSDRK